VSNWLVEEIVFTDNFDERVALVSRLIDVMEVNLPYLESIFTLLLVTHVRVYIYIMM